MFYKPMLCIENSFKRPLVLRKTTKFIRIKKTAVFPLSCKHYKSPAIPFVGAFHFSTEIFPLESRL